MRRKAIVAALAALALVGAAACGAPSKNADKGGSNGATQAKFNVVWEKDAKGPAKDISGAQKGGTISVITAAQPSTFDPTQVYYTDSLAISKLTIRTLVELSLGTDGNYHLMPDIATDLGEHNKDFTEWTFHLKQGIKYEDGTEVTSADFAYSAMRSFALKELPGGPLYQTQYFLDGDKYQGPWVSGTNYAGVQTPDKYTIVYKMARPFTDFPYYATFPVLSPIPQAKDTKDQYGKHPVSTGPYKWKSYEPGKSLVLVKNDQWDPNTDPGRHQYADEYDFSFGQDAAQVQQRLVTDTGQDQTALTYDDVLSSDVPKINADTSIKDRMLTGVGTCVTYVYIDTRKVPLDVRRALAVAYPFDQVNKAGGVTPLTNEPATTILPKVIPDWQNYDVVGNGGKGPGDPAKAKEMLQKAGKLGFQLVYAYNSSQSISGKVSEARKQAFEAAGFTVKAIPLAGDKLRDEYNNPKSEIQLRFLGWCPDWPSASTVFPAILYGPLIKAAPDSVPNASFLDDPKVNQRIDDILKMPADKQAPEWPKLGKQIMTDDLPLIPTGYNKSAQLHGSKIGGVYWDPYAGMTDLTKLFVKK